MHLFLSLGKHLNSCWKIEDSQYCIQQLFPSQVWDTLRSPDETDSAAHTMKLKDIMALWI